MPSLPSPVSSLLRPGARVLAVGAGLDLPDDLDIATVEFPGLAAEAGQRPDHLLEGDLAKLDGCRFEVIVADDVVGRVPAPLRVLRTLGGLLADGGSIVFSVTDSRHPEVASVVRTGIWPPLDEDSPAGVRIFTRAAVQNLVARSGLELRDVVSDGATMWVSALAAVRGSVPDREQAPDLEDEIAIERQRSARLQTRVAAVAEVAARIEADDAEVRRLFTERVGRLEHLLEEALASRTLRTATALGKVMGRGGTPMAETFRRVLEERVVLPPPPEPPPPVDDDDLPYRATIDRADAGAVLHRDDIYGSGPPDESASAELLAWIEPRVGHRVLDVGCGLGVYVEALAVRGHDTVGIEIESSTVAQAQALGRDVREMSSYQLDFPDDSFDSVIFVESLEHMDDYEAALEEAARVARESILITVPDISVLPAMSRRAVVPWHLLEATHVNFFTPESLRRTLLRYCSRVEVAPLGRFFDIEGEACHLHAVACGHL